MDTIHIKALSIEDSNGSQVGPLNSSLFSFLSNKREAVCKDGSKTTDINKTAGKRSTTCSLAEVRL